MDPNRREAVLTACAYACIFFDPQAYRDPNFLEPFWEGPGWLPTARQIRYINTPGGSRHWILNRISQGLDDEIFSPWTGGFWQGLKLSGALSWTGKQWRIGNSRPALIEDLQRMQLSKRIGKPDNQDRRMLKECYAVYLPPRDQNGADVLAGFFAGAKLRESADRHNYFVVPATERVSQFIDKWGMTIDRKTKEGYGLSPFYAALTLGYLPTTSALRILTIRHAVQCPMLPLAYWEVLFGSEGGPIPSAPWALPFACADITRKRHKWKKKILHQAAVKLGVAHVSPMMRDLIVDWRRNRDILHQEEE
jgi:hypothetical protein